MLVDRSTKKHPQCRRPVYEKRTQQQNVTREDPAAYGRKPKTQQEAEGGKKLREAV
jgi:hypothetical protein